MILIYIYLKKNGHDNNDKKMNNNNNNNDNVYYIFKRREVMVTRMIQMNGRKRKLVPFLDGCPLSFLHEISDLIC